MSETTLSGPYASLRIREYRLFTFARVCITLAIQIQGTIVAIQVYDLTHDSFSLGLIGLAEAIPAISVALYAGHVADIVARKKIIIATVSVLLLCSVALLSFTLNFGHFIFRYGATPIYAVIFISGIARGFLTPANFAFMPQLVPQSLYANAISLNSTFWEAASIAGPVLAGIIYQFGISATYATDVTLVAASLVFYLSIPNKSLPPVTEEQGIGEKIASGLKFVFNNQIVLAAISLDLFAVLFGGAVALLPAFCAEILHVGAKGLGLLKSAPSIGAILMAIYITHHPIRKHIGRILLMCVAGFGLCMIGFGLSTSFWLSAALLVLSGMFDSVSVIVRSTLIHTLTPENMKGRVAAVNSIFVGSSNEIGAFESGAMAKLLGGLVRSVVVGGFLTLGVVGITTWRARKLRRLDSIH